MAAALDPETFSSAVSSHLNVPNGMDGAEHTLYRAVVDKYMAPERTATIAPICQAAAEDLVAGIPSDMPVDVVGGLGRRYAVRAQSQWLGWPAVLEDPLLQWIGDNHAATGSGELADDFVGNAPLLLTEIVSILRNWTAGDLGSISRCVGSIVNHLAQNPELQTELRSQLLIPAGTDTAFLDAATDEMLRIENPFLSNRRKTIQTLELDGHSIEAGRRVYLDWVEANRDPAVFGDPDAYRPTQNAASNLVYAIDKHVCPGRGLSTRELRVATVELLYQTTAIMPAPGLENVRETAPLGDFGSVHVILTKKEFPAVQASTKG